MPARIHNFSAGPAALPLDVLEEVRDELLSFRDAGASIMEISHRSPQYTAVADSARASLKRLLGLGDDWHVLFLQGGASLQFYQVPLNLLPDGGRAAYLDTGEWAHKALAEARHVGEAYAAASSATTGYDHIPDRALWTLRPDTAYLHYTSNNTIYGTQFHATPDVDIPLVCDASSDFLSRPIDLDAHGLVYAGAQKNLGPAGVTLVLVRDDMLERSRGNLPTMLAYATHAAKLFHTPPAFTVYVVEKVLRWIERNGGLSGMEQLAADKAGALYHAIDRTDFYRGHARTADRSRMNVTFRTPSEQLDAAFAKQATAEGLHGLAGYRTVGGIRASIYNAVPRTSVDALVSFMAEFERTHG